MFTLRCRSGLIACTLACWLVGINLAASQTITLIARSVQPGEVVRAEVAGPSELEGVAALVFGKRIPLEFDEQRQVWNTLIGIDLSTKPGVYQLTIGKQARVLRVLPKQFTVRRLHVAEDFVNPPQSAMDQIARDNRKTAKIFETVTPRRWSGPFVLPVDGIPTSSFGTVSYFNGQRRSPHTGVDFLSATGTPIRASNHGTVALAEPLYFTGNTVIIDYGDGLYSLFAHLSELRVKEGDVVAPDTIVGLVGATGRVTGPHLHWTVRLHGARVDATSLVFATK
jgi:murein DD-endopeptidase MepM/ murein hydrolase activator NlpD